MKKLTLTALFIALSACAPEPTVIAPNTCKAIGYEYDLDALNYELVWSDEFDVDGEPDPTRWGFDEGGGGWGNRELQFYTRGDNVEIRDGQLIIEARKEERGRYNFTSTRLVSRNRGDWRYGKFEISAKMPDVLGTWSAIWMLPTVNQYGSWPTSGEIDIMEGLSEHKACWHYHYLDTSGNHQGPGGCANLSDSTGWHIFAVNWQPGKLTYYYDGIKVGDWTVGVVGADHFIILNYGINDRYGINVPATMLVDYVRVWKPR